MTKNSGNRKLWASWTLYCGLGEFLGIAAAAAIAVLFNNLVGEPTTSLGIILLFAAAILSGTIEGSITGSLQARVLKEAFSVDFKRWVF